MDATSRTTTVSAETFRIRLMNLHYDRSVA
jgi:hypothetical protein